MMKRAILPIVVLSVMMWVCPPASADPVEVGSKVEAVTLYRGQARVTRVVTLPKESGELELVVGDLPGQILGESLSASAADGVTIRAVRYRSRAVADEPKKEVAELDQKIKDLNRKLQVNAEMARLIETKARYVVKLEDFTAATAKADAGKSTLDPKAVGDMTGQIFDQQTAMAKERIKLREEVEDIQEQLQLLHRKRNELTGGAGRTVREAVIFVTKAQKADAAIRLSYLVNSATWTPAYNIRTDDEARKLTLEYLAQVQQTSGEDWSGVKLMLSTATPAMNAQSPLLSPLWINLQGPGVSNKGGAYSYVEFQIDNANSQMGVLGSWSAAASQSEKERVNWDLNRIAAEQQSAELNVSGDLARAGTVARRSVEEGLAVSYTLDGPMSVASRSDSQLVEIAKIDLDADSYHAAIPLLTTYVYRVARAANTSKIPLLSGRYSAYVGGEFVGRGDLPLVARGQKFTVGLGVDTQVRCQRELMEKSDEIVWGSRVQKFSYRLRLESYKDKPVAVRLLDRMPASKAEEIKVSLDKTSDKLSTDEVYVRDLKGSGMLRWDLTVAANASGAAARDVTYGFEMKYAKDAHIGKQAAPAAKPMEADFRRMMQS